MTKRFWYDFEDCTGAKIVDFKEDKEYSLETIGDFRAIEELLNMLHEENEQLKSRINSRLHYYRVLYESTNDNIVKRVVEDLEDILK